LNDFNNEAEDFMKRYISAALIVCGLYSNLAGAAEKEDFHLKTTQDLLDLCTAKPGQPLSTEAIHFCEGYIVGAIVYHDSIVGKDMKRIICYPQGTTRNDARTVLTVWGDANRDDAQLMNAPAMYGLVRALQSKWPCNP
jgi:hypothetical protein